ncbi:hypothetical protein TSUD_276040 [Trifolium subterraneum]|uniref:TIR domain-containing protein n=1 Tax=Trifolium subterraneum TaxID=3900 RepID=A0A2Z6MZS5_TRISU|nr:hypothetical protein TSUD_276040 [Trifolium subterraneum]
MMSMSWSSWMLCAEVVHGMHILRGNGVDKVYSMKEMNLNEATELFSWHAFKQASPKEEFVGISRNVVMYSGGLPLALEILGRYFFERKAAEWRCVLEKLKRIPNDKVQKKLKISYDGLDDDYMKAIFLDIACFFIGMDLNDVIHILNACGFFAENGISVLVERSLVTINDKNKLGMHDLLRDMGREIICDNPRREPEERSRLWFHEDVDGVLEGQTNIVRSTTTLVRRVAPPKPPVADLLAMARSFQIIQAPVAHTQLPKPELSDSNQYVMVLPRRVPLPKPPDPKYYVKGNGSLARLPPSSESPATDSGAETSPPPQTTPAKMTSRSTEHIDLTSVEKNLGRQRAKKVIPMFGGILEKMRVKGTIVKLDITLKIMGHIDKFLPSMLHSNLDYFSKPQLAATKENYNFIINPTNGPCELSTNALMIQMVEHGALIIFGEGVERSPNTETLVRGVTALDPLDASREVLIFLDDPMIDYVRATMNLKESNCRLSLRGSASEVVLQVRLLEADSTSFQQWDTEDQTWFSTTTLQGNYLWNTAIMLRFFLSFRRLQGKGVLFFYVFIGAATIVYLKIFMFSLYDELQLVQSKTKLATGESKMISDAIESIRKVIVDCSLQCCSGKEPIFGSEYGIDQWASCIAYAHVLCYNSRISKHENYKFSKIIGRLGDMLITTFEFQEWVNFCNQSCLQKFLEISSSILKSSKNNAQVMVSKEVPRSLVSIIIWKDKFAHKFLDYLQVVHAISMKSTTRDKFRATFLMFTRNLSVCYLEGLFHLANVKMVVLNSSVRIITWDPGKFNVFMAKVACECYWRNSLSIYGLLNWVYGRRNHFQPLPTGLNEESQLEPEPEEALKTRRNASSGGTKAVEGLALKLPKDSAKCYSTTAFKKMKKLRLLKLDGVKLDGDFEYLSRNLRWLSWNGFPLSCIPTNFYQGNLVSIELENSNVKLMWKDTPRMEKLRILNLNFGYVLHAIVFFKNLKDMMCTIVVDVALALKNMFCYFSSPSRGTVEWRNFKTMMCIVYTSTPGNITLDGLKNMLVKNYTKATIQLYKREALISFENEEGQRIMYGPRCTAISSFNNSVTSHPCRDILKIHEVFLSFRGEDTRLSFTSHLYASLQNAGIKIFRDDNSLRRGDHISKSLLRAIEESQIALIVFSKSYANSQWCLQELEKIMECNKTIGQVVLPVFYGVDPSEVRYQTGEFGKGFQNLLNRNISKEKEKSFSEVEATKSMKSKLRWENALAEAAGLAGFVVLNSRNEMEAIKDIVKNVTRLLDKTDLFIVDNPVGVESRVRDMIQRLNIQQSNDIILLGMWGMGGVGKTTIAKAIYNKIGRNFEGRSFLTNIREVWEQISGQVYLQEQLLFDICKETKTKIQSIESGKSLLKDRLLHKRVLLVLDDVSTIDQLNALCGSHKWLGSGSRIIITTRDMHILRGFRVDQVYKMKEMNKSESIELFSWHAFKKSSPKEDFLEISRNVVEYSGGLPLALEVLGSYLFDRGIAEWKCVLEKLKRIPNDEVQKKLKISYDGLNDDTLKEIFLDVSCFFIGMDRNDVIHILNGCGLFAEIGISVLVERSLVTVDDNNTLGMHDLLRDMGREIIRKKSPKEPEERTRLWFDKDVLDVLLEETGTKTVEGLTLKLARENAKCISTKAFKKMTRLRLLQLDGNLVSIELENSNIKLLWKETQRLEKLKILNLSHSRYLTQTPDFSSLPNLEQLVLSDCPRLSEIDKLEEDLEQMESLTTLLANNTAITRVPFSVVSQVQVSGSKLSLKSLLIQMGMNCQVTNVLKEKILQNMDVNGTDGCFLPGDSYPNWLTFSSEGCSVTFQVPQVKGHNLKTLMCIVYTSTPDNTTSDGLKNVLVKNYTKATIQLYKREALVSFEDEEWKRVVSSIEPGNRAEVIFVFENDCIVEKTTVYLVYDDKPIGEELELYHVPDLNVISCSDDENERASKRISTQEEPTDDFNENRKKKNRVERKWLGEHQFLWCLQGFVLATIVFYLWLKFLD